MGVHYGRSANAAHQIARSDRLARRTCRRVQADLADPGAPEQLVDAVEREPEPSTSYVANHGHSRPHSSLKEMTAEESDQTLAVDARARFLARRVLPGIRDRRFGRIMFTSSIAGLTVGWSARTTPPGRPALHRLRTTSPAAWPPNGV